MMKGPRNEAARQRHRQRKKEECGCVSVPASAVASEASCLQLSQVELNELNHFGWTVCGKFAVDSEFERLMQYQEKPSLPEVDDQKSTYVLCTPLIPPTLPVAQDDRPAVCFKGTQTSDQEVPHPEFKKEKKKNLISEFLFIPITQRSRSRSPSTGRSKLKTLGMLTDEPRVVIKGKRKQKLIGQSGSIRSNLDDKKRYVDNYEHLNARKYADERGNEIRKGNEDVTSTWQTASEAKESNRDYEQKLQNKTKYSTYGGTDRNRNPGEYNKMEKSSVTFHLNPVNSKFSSSEHIIRTDDLRRKRRA